MPPSFPGDSGDSGYGAGGFGPSGGTPGDFGAPSGGNKAALWSMILGIISILCCGFITGIPAIILGLKARKEIEVSGGRQTGSGQATAGIVLGIIAVVLTVVYAILVATGVIDPFTLEPV